MDITRIDHVELYVGDARQSAFFFCAAFGFHVRAQGGPETGLTDQRSLLLRQGDIAVVVTSGLTPDHPATRYVQQHGDGVAVVAFGVDDVDTALAEVVSRGAVPRGAPPPADRDGHTVRSAVVSGFGDVLHRLVTRRGNEAEFLPGLVDTDPAAPESADGLLTTIDHLAVCVPSGQLEPTVAHYCEVFGWDRIFDEYIEVGGQGMESAVVQSPSRKATFTLLEPDPSRRAGQIDDFLQWHAGAGVQHVAFGTDDIVRAVDTLSQRGIRFLGAPSSYFDALRDRLGDVGEPLEDLRRLGILVDRDHSGELFQIFTESVHVRRTLFLEVIERKGALTFGSSNIRALYEAKERERNTETVTAEAEAVAAAAAALVPE